MKKTKKWRIFETLVADIHSCLETNPSAKVLHDIKLLDKKGNKRQIDVLIELSVDDMIYRTAIECKTAKKRVTVMDVDAFRNKLKTLGIHQGIIVSKYGFQKGAFNAVKRTNIKLHTLAETPALLDYFRQWKIGVYELRHDFTDVVARFAEFDVDVKELTGESPLYAPGMIAPTSIPELVRLHLQAHRPSRTDQFFTLVSDPFSGQPNTATFTITGDFPGGMEFRANENVILVIGFRAEIKSTLVFYPSSIEAVSTYQQASTKKEIGTVLEANLSTAAMERFVRLQQRF